MREGRSEGAGQAAVRLDHVAHSRSGPVEHDRQPSLSNHRAMAHSKFIVQNEPPRQREVQRSQPDRKRKLAGHADVSHEERWCVQSGGLTTLTIRATMPPTLYTSVFRPRRPKRGG